MKGLTTTLLAAQRGASATPYVAVSIVNKALTTTYSFYTTDSPNRLLAATQTEGRFSPGGGSAPSPSAIVEISNDNLFFQGKDLRGWKVSIDWGFVTGAGNEYVRAAPMWVVSQQNVSREGKLVCRLTCMDIWTRMGWYGIMSGGTRLAGTITGTYTFNETVTGSVSGVTAKFFSQGSGHIIVKLPSGSFSAGETVTGATSGATITGIAITTGGIGLPPAWPGTIAITTILSHLMATLELQTGDNNLTIDIAESLQAGTPTTACGLNTSYQELVSTLMAFTKSGLRFRDSSGMRILAILDSPQTRLVGTPVGTFTVGETVTQAVSGATGRLVYQSATYVVIEATTGTFNTTNVVSGATASLTPTSISTLDYDYDSTHVFYSSVNEAALVLPNRVISVAGLDDSGNYVLAGAAVDQTSIDAWGTATEIFDLDRYAAATTQADVDNRASARMSWYQLERYQGGLVVPMNVGQEVWDLVQLVDSRSGVTTTARVGRLTRQFKPSTYVLSLELGGQIPYPTSLPPPWRGGYPEPEWDLGYPPVPPSPPRPTPYVPILPPEYLD